MYSLEIDNTTSDAQHDASDVVDIQWRHYALSRSVSAQRPIIIMGDTFRLPQIVGTIIDYSARGMSGKPISMSDRSIGANQLMPIRVICKC